MKFNQRKPLLQRNGVVIPVQREHIAHHPIFERILNLLIAHVLLLVQDGRKLNQVVGVYPHTPVPVAFHPDQVFPPVVVHDRVEQVRVDLAETSLFI
jgi:hypothetical protein